ncbi:MAG: hypothetical protein L0211_26740, partial [Planctomycetaceae bacterium]|nr:hypothetical protein [Planctomycetaceae bacterium]
HCWLAQQCSRSAGASPSPSTLCDLQSGMSSLTYRNLRAPEADAAALIDPPASNVPSIISENATLLQASSGAAELLGQLRRAARQRVVQLACSYTASYRQSNVSFLDGQETVVMAGHQPELFHPGVWFKSFLLSSIATQCSAQPINLIVDNDYVRSTSVLVPASDAVVPLPFDETGDANPWEERLLCDRALFGSFARTVRKGLEKSRRAAPNMGPLIVESMWAAPAMLDDDLQQTDKLGLLLARYRNRLESRLGLSVLDLPLSQVAGTLEFRKFVAMLLAGLASFAVHHNQCLHEYRLTNRVRSRAHPVAELASDTGWIEAPLWIWTTQHPLRRRAFVHRRGQRLMISDHHRLEFPIEDAENLDKSAEQLAAAEAAGIKIRPRALITTMYARLVLSDLFIHGIGGAKYDELTDEIIRRLFGIEPPRYLTATATFRLPIQRPAVTIDDVRSAARAVRDVRFRPESLIGHPLVAGDAALERELMALAAQKREYVRSHTLRRARHEVFDGLDRINASMHEKLKPLAAHLRAEHARLVEQLQQARTLGSREFSFVLYPEEYLVPRLLALAAPEK